MLVKVSSSRWLALVLAVVCLSAPGTEALDWCFPRVLNNPPPCPDVTPCCSIWGICGNGTFYCRQEHCAYGACLGDDGLPLPASPPLPPSPAPSPPPPSPTAVVVVPAPAPPSVVSSPPPVTPTPSPSPSPTPSPGPNGYVFVPLTDDQKRRMYQLTSIFENADTTLQYGYADTLRDGRGVTYGFCGFTTGLADGIMVIDEYTRLKPNNPLARPDLYAKMKQSIMKGDKYNKDKLVKEFMKIVPTLTNDPDFIKAQWTVCDSEYHQPAMRWCMKVGCRLALSKAQFHDALVNHGEGLGDKGSVDYIFIEAQKVMKGTPLTGVDEVEYLKAFLAARRNMLWNYDSVWRASVKRVDIYRKLVDMGNLNLDGPIYFDLEKRSATNGGPKVWQVNDVYYGKFIVYNTTVDPSVRKLELVP